MRSSLLISEHAPESEYALDDTPSDRPTVPYALTISNKMENGVIIAYSSPHPSAPASKQSAERSRQRKGGRQSAKERESKGCILDQGLGT
jgi:hypothetical protein